MDGEVGKFLATLGVGGTLAAFIFYFYRRDALRWGDAMQDIVKENTAAITELTEYLKRENGKTRTFAEFSEYLKRENDRTP